jgi:hypothetical protein
LLVGAFSIRECNLRPDLKQMHGGRRKLIQETSTRREWVSMEKHYATATAH